MIRMMIKKADFSVCQQMQQNIYKIMFAREDVYDEPTERDEEGNIISTGERKETDYCNATTEMFYHKPSPDFITRMLKDYGLIDMSEANELLSHFTDNTVPYMKDIMLNNIALYDKSDKVNGFTLGGRNVWIPVELRNNLRNLTLPTEKARGKEETSLWLNGVSYTLPITTIEGMLQSIEEYAKDCLDVTETHKSAVNGMTSVEELIAFDYKADYPERLSF